MPRTPSIEDQERAIRFLVEKHAKGRTRHEPNPRLQIYQILLHSDTPLSPRQICDRMGNNGAVNNVDSKLNNLARYGLVKRVGVTQSDISGRAVTLWDVEEVVPCPIEFRPPDSWFLAFNSGGTCVDCVPSNDISLKEMVERHPTCSVVRVVRCGKRGEEP